MILEARDISFSYERKGAELFSNIKFKVENNERVWVPGPSGYGKTTLCKILAGYLEPCKGQILLDGKPLPKKGYCPVQMIWQHPERTVNPRLKMEKILSDGGQVENGDRRRLAEPVSSGIIRWGIAAFLYCKSTGKRDKVSDCRRDQYHAGSHHAEPDLEFSAG